MATASSYTASGTKSTTTVKLDNSVFATKVDNHELIKVAYLAYLANKRDNSAITKTRGLVSGGGKKPWRQKGTGRARVGSSRNPIWRGGGVVFGPTGNENYTIKLPLAQKRKALRQALTLASENNKLIVIEDIKLKETKTQHVAKLLTKIGASGKVLIVINTPSDALSIGVKNLQNVKLAKASYITVYDLINADQVVLTKDALNFIEEWLGGNK